jgi:hypothetical protein
MKHKAMLAALLLTGASEAQQCPPRLDGMLGDIQVYRMQDFDDEVAVCIPGLHSIVVNKQKPVGDGLVLLGFVVGLEELAAPQTSTAWLKITTKAGGNATIVYILEATQDDRITRVPGGEFASNLAAIHLAMGNGGEVRVLNQRRERACLIVEEEKFLYTSGEFGSSGVRVLEQQCE